MTALGRTVPQMQLAHGTMSSLREEVREIGTDLPADERAGLLARVREVRADLAGAGPPRTRGPTGDFARVSVPATDCDAVRDLLIGEQVTSVVEVGLAYASSALAICEALLTVGGRSPLHLAIDPMQASAYSDVGRELVCAAGLERVSRLITERSQIALPQLVSGGLTVDAAFVDGSHRFHEVFVDLYFLRSLVRPGGLIVLDDHWWPSVATAAGYYERDLGWELLDGLPGGSVGPGSGQPRVRALRLPATPHEPAFDAFEPF